MRSRYLLILVAASIVASGCRLPRGQDADARSSLLPVATETARLSSHEWWANYGRQLDNSNRSTPETVASDDALSEPLGPVPVTQAWYQPDATAQQPFQLASSEQPPVDVPESPIAEPQRRIPMVREETTSSTEPSPPGRGQGEGQEQSGVVSSPPVRGTPSDAPEPVPADAWSLCDLEEIALQHNPTLVQAAAAVQSAEGNYVQQGLYPNPWIGYGGGDMGLENTAGQQGMVLGQEVVTKGKLRLAQSVASHEIDQSRYALDAQQQRVLNDVRTGYYQVLLAQKTVEVSERLVAIGQEAVDVNEQLRQQMEVSKPVVLQSRIEANTARLRLVEGRKAYDAAWRRLASVIGRPELPQQQLAGDPNEDLPEFTWEEVLDHVLTQSPELSQAYVGVERARCELARQCAGRWPNYQLQSWVKYEEPTDDVLLDLQVSVGLPIFNRNQGAIMDAEAALIAAEREVERVRLSLINRLASAFERYAVAIQQVQIYNESIIPDAKESLELANSGYREGEFGYINLLVAQVTYFDASLNSLERLNELWASSIQLDGLLLSGGLRSP